MTPQSQASVADSVRASLNAYLRDLDGAMPSDVHAMVLDAVEKPMLEVIMAHVDNNQSKASQCLGINRNTLRKKLLHHGLLR